jgi:hypothetical protein
MLRRWYTVAPLAALIACGAPPKTVSFRMAGTPPFASVTIDDENVGSLALVASRGVALPPGKHRVTVEAPGYFPEDREVEAMPGSGPLRLDLALVKIPDE